MTDLDAIRTAIRRLAAKRAASGTPPRANDASLVGEGALDSLAFVELIAEVEEEFGVEIDFLEADAEEFTTLDGLAGQVAAALDRAGGADAHAGLRQT